MSKKYLEFEKKLLKSRDAEGELNTITDFRSGEALLNLIKLGFSVLEISDILYLKPKTIELRILEYVKEKGLSDEVEVTLIKTKGLIYIETLKEFFNSSINDETIFVKVRGNARIFKKAVELYSSFDCIKNKLIKKHNLLVSENKTINYVMKKKIRKHSTHPIKIS